MAFCRLIRALYSLSSVITIKQEGQTVRLIIDGNLLSTVSGHSVQYADGLIIRKGTVTFDQPNVTRQDVDFGVETVVHETIADHEVECLRVGVMPAVTLEHLNQDCLLERR